MIGLSFRVHPCRVRAVERRQRDLAPEPTPPGLVHRLGRTMVGTVRSGGPVGVPGGRMRLPGYSRTPPCCAGIPLVIWGVMGGFALGRTNTGACAWGAVGAIRVRHRTNTDRARACSGLIELIGRSSLERSYQYVRCVGSQISGVKSQVSDVTAMGRLELRPDHSGHLTILLQHLKRSVSYLKQ